MFTKEPIRKRGYYRALKAGKPWATLKKTMRDLMADYAAEMFKPNPLVEMLKLEGLSASIPIIYKGSKPEGK